MNFHNLFSANPGIFQVVLSTEKVIILYLPRSKVPEQVKDNLSLQATYENLGKDFAIPTVPIPGFNFCIFLHFCLLLYFPGSKKPPVKLFIDSWEAMEQGTVQ